MDRAENVCSDPDILAKEMEHLCFVMVVGSFQLKNAFSKTGYPAFYQWEQSLKEMKWFCLPITIPT